MTEINQCRWNNLGSKSVICVVSKLNVKILMVRTNIFGDLNSYDLLFETEAQSIRRSRCLGMVDTCCHSAHLEGFAQEHFDQQRKVAARLREPCRIHVSI